MKHLSSVFRVALILVLSCFAVQAQSSSSPAGRWVGNIDLGGVKVGLLVNFTQKSANEWTGTISIPAQGMSDTALSKVAIKDEQITFAMPDVPGNPTFAGKLAKDNQAITGELTQSGKTFPFQLGRESKEAASATPAKGVPGTGFAGEWQGTLDAGAMTLRLIFRVTNATEDSFSVSLDSPDQGVTEMKADSASGKEKSLRTEWKRIGAVYEGKLNQDGSEITGEFQQGGQSFPLTLKRLAINKPKPQN